MQHFIWAEACREALYADQPTEAVQAGDKRVSAIGLFARRGFFPARLFLAGAEELWEPIDVVYADRAGAAGLADTLLAKRKPLRFGHFPATSEFAAALAAAAPGAGILLSTPVSTSPYITLDESWKTPEDCFTSRRRSDLRRMTRKANELGAVEFKVLSPGPEEVDHWLDVAVAVEQKSWKARTGTDLAHNDAQQKFYRAYARLAAREGIFRICLMRIGGNIAAIQIAVECDNAFWLFKIGYDEAFSVCSPGNLLMLESLRYAAKRGLSSFEFLGASAPWTKVWTETERPNIRLRYYPHGPAGYLALAQDAAVAATRRAIAKFKDATKKAQS